VSMSVDGLISGMDTTALINQLIKAEGAQQNALVSKLSATKDAASAFRTVNTTFAAVRAAAEAMLKPESWTATKASSSSADVSVTSRATATSGSLTFSVEELAAAHSVFRTDPAWTEATKPAGFTSLDVFAADGITKKGTIPIGGSQSLNDAAAAINGSAHGLSAAVVKTDTGTYALQVTSRKTGADNAFSLQGGGTFAVSNAGKNAKITVGTVTQYSVVSDTNTFADVIPGTTITVSAKAKASGIPVTVDVAADPEAVATKVQTLVDAVNAAISTVKDKTNNAKGSTAALKGDFSVSQLAGRLLDAVSFAIGRDGSPAKVGLELSKTGTVTFTKSTFLTALEDDPVMTQRMLAGAPGGTAADGTAVAAVTGLAERLLTVSKAASDAATGSLVKFAEGQDSMVKDIQDRISAWDLRLAKRKEMLTRQFSAMETALSSLKNQSSWLAGQINSLPTYS
jgi:flagellar capping protein FliD